MDWSKYDGLWVPCAGSVTPWKTHLGGEEYEPDARALHDLARDFPDGTEWTEQRIASWGLMYLGVPETTTNKEVVDMLHPYMYGYPWEVRPAVACMPFMHVDEHCEMYVRLGEVKPTCCAVWDTRQTHACVRRRVLRQAQMGAILQARRST
jgi:hypothetical protein